ncbi:MAG TPA: tRNA (adenosine(37)-N6)-threonylcarbamoyltransferase complex transferase subunit TsaD [bacterium]|nr:tRNA (adenosine(37)-N6)-threonylcarbamoyltransferase complex transferase subunit TsaD [bacterium]
MMRVLGIETSCDETSAALIDESGILANVIATQKIHEAYGGVVPEFASRAHMRQLPGIIRLALKQACIGLTGIDALAVTCGPGLAGSLLVGLSMCKGLALALGKPFIGINHIEGHILATAAQTASIEYPFICLVASGGHTLLVLVREPLRYEIVGRTIDDAAGEAFDKVAKVLGLGYPGGPLIEKSARGGNPGAIAFPRALTESGNLDFSFSGLKTAVLYYAQALAPEEGAARLPDIAASFQQAVIDALFMKSQRALEAYGCHTLVLAGGVMRNVPLRETFTSRCQSLGIALAIPAPELCTDNAAMIAQAGLMHLQAGEHSDFSLDVAPNLSL